MQLPVPSYTHETFGQAEVHGQVFRRASIDPGSGDLADMRNRFKNDTTPLTRCGQCKSSEENGDLGDKFSYAIGWIEAMNDLANHPLLKFRMNAMVHLMVL